MPENRRVQRNNSSISNSSLNHNIEEAIRRLRIHSDGKEDETDSTVYPDRPGEPDCIYYLRTGACGYGDNCRFNHPTYNAQMNHHGGDLPERIGEPDCVYFLKTGTCKYGSTCKYNHPRDRRGLGPVVLNMVGLPMRQDQKSCSHYLRTGSCKFGVTCKFHHPQPPLEPTSHGGGPPPWPYPTPQTYFPVMLPPSAATHGWSPVGLPLRPGQPVCSYYSLYGICKYGPGCKYDHPVMVYSYNYPMGMNMMTSSVLPYATSNGKLSTNDSSQSHSD
ncbi:hypothetical protein Lser_V15G34789 [Lactuca serriola]